MREKIKKHIKKIVPLICIFTMLCGSVMSVNAKTIIVSPLNVGEEYTYTFTQCFDTGDTEVYIDKFKITSASSSVYFVPYMQIVEDGSYSFTMCLVSDASFKYKSYGTRQYNSDSPTQMGSTTKEYSATNSSGVYYRSLADISIEYSSGSIPWTIVNNDFPYLTKSVDAEYHRHFKAYNWLVENDFKYDDGNTSFYGDLSEGLSNSNIGWLKELKRTLLQYSGIGGDSLMESTKFKTRYSWLVENTDWDESYKVALYKKMVVEDKNLFKDNEIVEETDLVYIGSANYSDGKIEYYNEDIDYMEIFYNLASEYGLGYVSYYDDYLIIYHETEDGIEYGYWNQLLHDDDGLPSQEYGVFDDNGNFIEGGSLGDIDTESGIGSSEEDAENSVMPDNNDGSLGDDIDLEGSIGDIFGQFFNSLKNVFSFIGKFPSMISEFFGFLPVEVVSCISLGLIMVIALRFLGR